MFIVQGRFLIIDVFESSREKILEKDEFEYFKRHVRLFNVFLGW